MTEEVWKTSLVVAGLCQDADTCLIGRELERWRGHREQEGQNEAKTENTGGNADDYQNKWLAKKASRNCLKGRMLQIDIFEGAIQCHEKKGWAKT